MTRPLATHSTLKPLPLHSLDTQLQAGAGKPSGFDYLRLALALSIIGWHSVVTSYGAEVNDDVLKGFCRPFILALLPMFFALSGFLVAGSLERCKTLITFLGLRILRIFPALACDTLLSALVLGPALTTIPLSMYFNDPQFYSYFLNIIGDIHYNLPGIFPNNPLPGTVNAQLWTVPYELKCYVILTGLALLGIYKRRTWLLLFVVAIYGAVIFNLIFTVLIQGASYPPPLLAGEPLIMDFIGGFLLYKFRAYIPYHRGLFIASVIVSLSMFAIAPSYGARLVAIPVAYMTVYLGLRNPTRNKLLLSGDYSYSLFLYGFPLQQAVASFGPAMQHWYINLLIVIPLAGLISVASWWLIEKPALNLRRYLKA